MFSFCLIYFPQTGSLSVKADSTVSNILLNEQSSRGVWEGAGTPRGSVKFRYTIWTSGAVLSSRSSPKPQPPSSSPPLKWEELRWSLPFQAWMLPPLHPPDTTSSHDHFSLLYTLPLLCKDAAQGCNKIHTKVIFHKEKKLRNNCSSNAQQASDSWLPAWGALVMCS